MPMLRSIATLATLAALAVVPVSASAQASCDNIGGTPQDGAVYAPEHVLATSSVYTLRFNSSLDPNLEAPQFGDALARRTAFQQAVADWNAALAAVGAPLVLNLVFDDAAWAIEQSGQYCSDLQSPFTDVFTDFRGSHYNDGASQVSTGLNPGDANLDPGSQPLGAGWLLPSVFVSGDTTTGVVAIDQALAANKNKFDSGNPSLIIESDIAWYTHTHYEPAGFDPACPRTSWDFRMAGGPDANRYDFYSAMLHAVGHALGIGHQTADETGNNVMQVTLGKGQRRAIGAKELACLCARYGPGAPDCAIATATKRSTWGGLKSIYR